MTREEAIELGKKTAKKFRREVAVRNEYGNYSVWFRYTPGREGYEADAGAECGGALSCFVRTDGTVVDL